MNETITAIASGMTASGIGIIRISGPEAFAVLGRIFRTKGQEDVSRFPANTIHYGWICESDGRAVDECLVMIMRGPHTYTTEDTVEIDCHGGPFVMQKILSLVIRSGARPAEPGEFTKRAYLGGRIDLSEAEAVMDLIRARSDEALNSSLMQLSGSVRSTISELRTVILNEVAHIEAALDDPEHYDLSGYGTALSQHLTPVREKLRSLSATFREGRLVREGILTVILGKPNAGKSSLLNAITGKDRAIVTDIEGTTRDTLEEQVELGGITLRMIDTAGIRDARDQIEKIGIGRARTYAANADLILAVFDSARPLDQNDEDILSLIRGKKAVVLLNKSDLPPVVSEGDIARRTDAPVIRISAQRREGIEELEETIRRMFFSGHLNFNEETVITNARHKEAIDRAEKSLELVEQSIEEGMPEDFYSIDLMDAYGALSEVIGEEVSDDLVNTIFSKFCMGK